MTSNWKLPKWAVVIAAALLFLPLAVDWAQPGEGARLAAGWIGSTGKQACRHWTMFPIWRWLVGFAGRDVAALGWISVGAGLVCVWMVAAIFGAIFGAAVLLAGLAFALTPGFLVAATRVSPLMVALLPGLAAVALVMRPSKGRLLLATGAWTSFSSSCCRRR